jgi:hypothetical protein
MTLQQNEPEAAAGGAQLDFVKGADGRTVYYPYGPSLGGYVVPNERERALRDAAERLSAFEKGFFRFIFYALGLTFIAGMGLLIVQPSVAALYLSLVPITLWILLDRCIFTWQMGAQVRGLERVRGDPEIAHSLRHVAAGLIGGAALIWLVLHIYGERIAALSDHAGTINFYPDLSYSISASIFFGLLLWPAFRHHDDVADRVGRRRLFWGYLFIGVLAFFNVTGSVWNFFDPTPKIIIARNAVWCGTRTKWSDVAAISLVDGRRLTEYARLALKSDNPPQPPPGQFAPLLFPNSGPSTRCETTRLQVASSAAYAAIETAWKHAVAQAGEVPLVQSLDEIPIGSGKAQVAAVLGEAAVRLEGTAGRTHLYFVDPSPAASGQRPPGDCRRAQRTPARREYR